VRATGASVRGVSSSIDVAAERAATPGCATVAHLNNAGAALPTSATLDTVIAHLRLESEVGGYEAEAAVSSRMDGVRSSAAALLGCDPTEVAVTGSDTEGWTKALWGLLLGGGLPRGGRILVDRIAYDSHYLGLVQVSRVAGTSIEAVPSTGDGTLDLDGLAAGLAGGGVVLASLTHVGTHRGLVNPVAAAARLCRDAGVATFVDGCQSVGQLPVDVGEIGCDVLTATGRKWLRGPRGTGLVFVRSGFADRLHPIGIDGRSATWDGDDHYRLADGAQRFVAFESPVAVRLGLGTALDHALSLGMDAVAGRVGALAEGLRRELGALDGVAVHDGGRARCGIVTFTVDGATTTEVAGRAHAAGVNVSVTDRPAARLDLGGARPDGIVRASPHYYNTVEELDRLVEVVAGLAPG
jgi:cysteine desulfurase / selenocysteine lyase